MSYSEMMRESQEMQLAADLAQLDAMGMSVAACARDPEDDDQFEYDQLDAALRELGVKNGMDGIDQSAPDWEVLKDFVLAS